MLWRWSTLFLLAISELSTTFGSLDLDECPGYRAENVHQTMRTLKADLILAGDACNIYGNEIKELFLHVVYESDTRIHVKISDLHGHRYEVPYTVFPRPIRKEFHNPIIQFRLSNNPFSFSIVRVQTEEILFDTKTFPLIFAPQYLRLKTKLPTDANIYGLGEHTETFRLPRNVTRTLWSRDSIPLPPGSNLYGSHPIYFDQRATGTHGVFLLNSNGMDIKIRPENDGSSLEYNVIGGILDLYFLAGPSPIDVAKQYAEIVGHPAEVPYWSFGLHQCRFGYKDYAEVQDVISNYASAGIPLETMWTDIDYMDDRLVFTTDPVNFPLEKMRQIVKGLHENNQHYIMMVDPAVGTRPGMAGTYDRGTQADIWMKGPDGKDHLGVVWPGVVVWPDWFTHNAGSFWTEEFRLFFNPQTGIDIDGVWIDMNEPASFCSYPCDEAYGPIDMTKILANLEMPEVVMETRERSTGEVDLLNPPYAIGNLFPRLSDRTAHVDVVHANGWLEYDTHNLYGSMMSIATQEAMQARRPGLRTFVITRSTFAGAGERVGKWLGDNLSDWVQYRFSIAGMLSFASIYQMPMVGSDVCGFFGNTTEELCARWATLGAFNPFYRNHNDIASISQEFYRWPIVAEAAKKAIDIRYRLLDYIYTAFHQAHLDGTPVLLPLSFVYPKDPKTFGIEHQFFYGDAIMVSPVLKKGSTRVSIYYPSDLFYDFFTYEVTRGRKLAVVKEKVGLTDIPLHIRGGTIIPLRVASAKTTHALRKLDFELIVAPGSDGKAEGSLYFDDGISLVQPSSLTVKFTFDGSQLYVHSEGKYPVGSLKFALVTILGVKEHEGDALLNGKRMAHERVRYDVARKAVQLRINQSLDSSFSIKVHVPTHDEL